MAVLDDIEKFAAELMDKWKQIYSGPRDRAIARAEDVYDLSGDIYNDAQGEFQHSGFGFVADITDLTLKRLQPDLGAIRRVMSSGDATAFAVIAHYRSSGRTRLIQHERELVTDVPSVTNARVITINSEFSDGKWLEISNTRGLHPAVAIPNVTTLQLPKQSTVEELVEAHATAFNDLIASSEQRRPLHFNSLDDILACLRRQDVHESEFRRSVGYVMPQDIERLFGDIWYPWAVRKLKVAVARIQMREAAERDA